MGTVLIDITMSLDGFVTGPDAGLDRGLGIGGEPLHAWLDEEPAIIDRMYAETGAVLMGRRTFDFVDGPNGWGEQSPGAPPVFVVTSNPPSRTRLGARFIFETDLKDALTHAKAAAGEKDVVIMGGGHLCRQYLYAGLVDRLCVHVAPIVLGDGTPLFERTAMAPIRLVQEDATMGPSATHVTYRVEEVGDV